MVKRGIVNPETLREFLSQKGVVTSCELLEEIEAAVYELVIERIRIEKNRSRVVKNDELKEHLKATHVLDESIIAKLPSWVKADIDNALIVGSSRKVIQSSNGKKYHLSNSLNDLSGGEWTYFLNSVINTKYPTSGPESYAHGLRKIHPSPKPPQLMKQIIEFFTKENEWVFDFFMGVGGTLIGASLANRRAVGIDLSEAYIEVYEKVTLELGLKSQICFRGDSMQLLANPEPIEEALRGEQFSLILIDPPYGDMMGREKTGEAAKRKQDSSPTPFTAEADDLGNLPLDDFFPAFTTSVKRSLALLKDKGHVVVFIKDLQPSESDPNLLHARIIHDLNGLSGLQYIGMRIWADQGVNLYPYGYPYSFVANQIHQYILVFKKNYAS